MIEGRFVPLGEDWCCDQCAETISATLYAFVFERGQNVGKCYCIRCSIDPEQEGAADLLRMWRESPGYSDVYETHALEQLAPVSPNGFKPMDHTSDRLKQPGPKSYDLKL